MNVLLVAPKPEQSRSGNQVTARRWAGFLRELGHDVRVRAAGSDGTPADAGGRDPEGGGTPADAERPRSTSDSADYGDVDLLVALHARRSADDVRRFREARPGAPVVVALTGTDLYRDLDESEEARETVRRANRLVVLQEKALERLPPELRHRTHVIHQSVRPPAGEHPPREDVFEVCLLCHMRPVKDPFRAPEAARKLPSDSRVRIVHAGKALSPEMEDRARAEVDSNPRYDWVGELPRDEALALLARSRLLVLTSRMEGGANVVTEALACGTPVISSRIEGSVGLLGEGYPGYFPVGDTPALTARLHRAEVDGDYYRTLDEACRERAHLADPDREREAWAGLLDGLA